MREVVERSEARLDRHMTAVRAADRIRAAGIAGCGIQRIVRAFPRRETDWMDRGEVDHVEAHSFNVWDARLGFAQRRRAPGHASLRPWKQFVPRGKPRRGTV